MTGAEIARAETLAVYGATVPEFKHGRSASFWLGCRCPSCRRAVGGYRDAWRVGVEQALARTGSVAAVMAETHSTYEEVYRVLHRMEAA